jgi:transposase InsO family protein
VVDFVGRWSPKTQIAIRVLVLWLGISLSKFYDWRKRYGKVNEHNACVPRDHWLTDEEKQAMLDYEREHPLEGYRRLAFMMLDDDVAAASPATVYRVLKSADRLRRPSPGNERKGKGFHQPRGPHRHWHIDFSHVNICGTFYHLCSIIDGYSRLVVHWEIRETMFTADAEIVVQRAREKFPGENPRIISDNGPQFIAKDFKQFVRLCGMTHVTTSPYYPQSNGKKERWFGTLKRECLRPGTPLSLEEARRLVARFVEHYNTVRLHSAIGYVTPADKLLGLEPVIHAERDRKLETARELRRQMRQAARGDDGQSRQAEPSAGEPSAGSSSAQRRPLDLAALRRQVSMEDVLRHLGYFHPLRGPGPQRRGPCPLHDAPRDRHRSFSVHLGKGVFRCFHPPCQAQGNTLDLWAAYHRLPIGQAAQTLAETFAPGLTSPDKPVTEKRNPSTPPLPTR